MKRCVIIGASPQSGIDMLKKCVKPDDYVICADGGYSTAMKAGIVPSLFIGDGDSGSIPTYTHTIVLPVEKDSTDLQAALDHALTNGYKDFLLLCCTGSRFDHYFANTCLLERLAMHGAIGSIIDERNTIMLHYGGVMKLMKNPDYRYVSLLPLDEKITGVTLHGLKYPLNNVTVYRYEPLGVSNEFIADEAEIMIEQGRAFIVFSRD